jgi:hypothetical protein
VCRLLARAGVRVKYRRLVGVRVMMEYVVKSYCKGGVSRRLIGPRVRVEYAGI